MNRDDHLRTAVKKRYVLVSDGKAFQILFDEKPVVSLKLWPVGLDAGSLPDISFEHDAIQLRCDQGTVTLGVEHEAVVWRFCPAAEASPHLTCFNHGSISARQWQTFVFNGHDRCWDISENARVDIKSCNKVLGHVNANWFGNVPPRAVAFDCEQAGWLGISIPGAKSLAKTVVAFGGDGFSLEFFDYHKCTPHDALEVVFVPDLDSAEQSLEVHADLTRERGHWIDRSGHPDWWSLPAWGMYDENCISGGTSLAAPDARRSPLTAEKVRAWVEQLRELTGMKDFLLTYDQGYFRRYGQYTPVDSLGGVEGFRALIDELRDDGVRTALYMHPFHVDVSIPEIAQHPEWLVDNHFPRAPSVAGDMEIRTLDWTHPDARAHLREVVRRIVSPEPGCLNADWLMINNNHVPDPSTCSFHDSSWGIGDRMAYRVRKEMYDAAKSIKPDVLVSGIGVDPVLQDTADMFFVNESWTETCDNWYKMARVMTRTLPGVLLRTNAYILSHPRYAEFVTMTAGYGAPHSLPLSMIHTHGHSRQWQEMTAENHRRWAAALQVYAIAPATADQRHRVDFDGEVFRAWREYTKGPLAGFYAAQTIKRRVLATYSPGEARAMAFDYIIADIQLPPRAQPTGVAGVMHDGSTEEKDLIVIERDARTYVRLEMEDSGAGQTGRGGVLYYKIEYKMQ